MQSIDQIFTSNTKIFINAPVIGIGNTVSAQKHW